jgi:hypothetical protein
METTNTDVKNSNRKDWIERNQAERAKLRPATRAVRVRFPVDAQRDTHFGIFTTNHLSAPWTNEGMNAASSIIIGECLASEIEQSGAAEACWAHNPEVRRSKLRSAKYFVVLPWRDVPIECTHTYTHSHIHTLTLTHTHTQTHTHSHTQTQTQTQTHTHHVYIADVSITRSCIHAGSKKKKKWIMSCDHEGTRTLNLWIRSPAPYPLGHTTFPSVKQASTMTFQHLVYFHYFVSLYCPKTLLF